MKKLILIAGLFLIMTVVTFSQQYIRTYYPPGSTVTNEIVVNENMKPSVLDFPAGFDSCDVSFLMYTDRNTKIFNNVRFMDDTLKVSGVKANQTVLLQPAYFIGFSQNWKLQFSAPQTLGGYIIIQIKEY